MGFPSAPPPPPPTTKSPTTIIALFVGGMLALAVLAIVFVLLNQPKPPTPDCEPGKVCAPQPSLPPVASNLPSPGATSAPTTPPASLAPGATATPFVPAPSPISNSPIVLSGELWQSNALNYSFEYDPNSWSLETSTDDTAVFYSVRYDAQLVIKAVSAQTSPAELIAQQLGIIDTIMIGRVKDTDDYDALLGPSIGYVDGEGDVWSGVLLSEDGTPVAPGGVTVMAATDGRLTISVLVLVGSPDAQVGSGTQQHRVRGQADEFLKSFDWDTRS